MELLTTAEAAELLGVGPTTIKRWADEGLLPVVKTAGGHRRFRRADVLGMTGAADSLASRLPGMTGRELDALDVGVIQLDDAGQVVQYSRAEARFSGIRVADAVGRDFFGELAPCTNNDLVRGRFFDGVRAGHLDVHLAYTFTYRMKPTSVDLHLVRDAGSGTNWIVVKPVLRRPARK